MIEEIDNTTIDIISARLKNVVSPLDIVKWLNNFNKSELRFAIDIASNISVYTSYEIEEVINSGLFDLYPSLKINEVLVINPIGNFGKSGSMVTYFFQKTEFYRKNKSRVKMISAIENLEMDNMKHYKLVLLDDFIGSGNSVVTYYEEYIYSLKDKFLEINFVGIAGMKGGVELIRAIFKEVKIPTSNIFKKAFSSEASYFGYRNYSKHREFVYKYGMQLTRPKIRKDGSKKYVHALGYENSQALVSFSHGSPNNTLPIIWANKNGWIPLIPRFFNDKVNVSRELRKSISYELSILHEFGSQNLQDTFFTYEIKKGTKSYSSASKIDFSIYAVIKLSRAGYTSNNICQKLGIMTADYVGILSEGKRRGLFGDGNKLTLFGLQIYQDAKECIKRKKRSFEYESADYFSVRDIKYLPKQFNGRS